MERPDIETIHDSYINGQFRQMTKQIDEYGLYDFWSDFKNYLQDTGCSHDDFISVTIVYFRVKNR